MKRVTQRRLAIEALERSNASLEEFAYVSSHDFQEPLRGASGCVLRTGSTGPCRLVRIRCPERLLEEACHG